jgi:hypothetical protein
MLRSNLGKDKAKPPLGTHECINGSNVVISYPGIEDTLIYSKLKRSKIDQIYRKKY